MKKRIHKVTRLKSQMRNCFCFCDGSCGTQAIRLVDAGARGLTARASGRSGSVTEGALEDSGMKKIEK